MTEPRFIPEDMRVYLGFSLQGRWYLENAEVVPVDHARQGRYGLGSCHANAKWLARRWPNHYRWWSGYAVDQMIGIVDNHSWVQLADASHLEVTYDTPAHLYLGVPVPDLGEDHYAQCTFHPNECVALMAAGAAGHRKEED